MPDQAPEARLRVIERPGGRVLEVHYDDWRDIIVTSRADGVDGLFVHHAQDRAVTAGNGTIGLEIPEDPPGPDVVVIPYRGGGLTCGIASAIKTLRPRARGITPNPGPPQGWPPRSPPGSQLMPVTGPWFAAGGGRRVLDSVWPPARLASRGLSVLIGNSDDERTRSSMPGFLSGVLS